MRRRGNRYRNMSYTQKRTFKRVRRVIFLVITLLLIGSAAGWYFYNNYYTNDEVEEVVEVVDTRDYFLDICVDSLNVEKKSVGYSETISDILGEYNITPSEVYNLSLLDKEILDVRKIKTGNNYYIVSQHNEQDSVDILKYFVYEESLTDFVICDFVDSISVRKFTKDVTVVEKELKGTITSSLYMSIKESGGHDDLTYLLSDIYQWTVDFYGIQSGDNFTVVYTEKMVDTCYVGVGEIKAARFQHIGKDYFAVEFQDGETRGFWDENGESLKKSFLKAPLKFSRISSTFSGARMHPVLRVVRAHYGVDYAAPTGTPVWAVADGVVIHRAYAGQNGNYVKIKHHVRNGRYMTGYLHLSRFAKGIVVGSHVSQGDVIGYVGATGIATGPHLDFRIWENGKPINPLKMTQERGKPISDSVKVAYSNHKDSMINILAKIDFEVDAD